MICRRNKLMQNLFDRGFTVNGIRNMTVSNVAITDHSYLTPTIDFEEVQELEMYLNSRDGRPFMDKHPGCTVSGMLFPSSVTGGSLTTRQIKAIKRSNKALRGNQWAADVCPSGCS